MSVASKFDIGMYSDVDVRELLAHAIALEAMLKKHEWDGFNFDDDENCSCCPECERGMTRGHSIDCQLAKLLGGGEL